MKKYTFETLEAWRAARALRTKVYKLSTNFPKHETYHGCSRLRGAAVSVVNNLPEGSGRATAKDQAPFSVLAYSSTPEVFNLLFLAADKGYIQEAMVETYRADVNEVTALINGLRKSQLRRARAAINLAQNPGAPYETLESVIQRTKRWCPNQTMSPKRSAQPPNRSARRSRARPKLQL